MRILLQLLHADKRREYLYQLQNTMMLGNSRNWRLRYELAKYLSPLSASSTHIYHLIGSDLE